MSTIGYEILSDEEYMEQPLLSPSSSMEVGTGSSKAPLTDGNSKVPSPPGPSQAAPSAKHVAIVLTPPKRRRRSSTRKRISKWSKQKREERKQYFAHCQRMAVREQKEENDRYQATLVSALNVAYMVIDELKRLRNGN